MNGNEKTPDSLNPWERPIAGNKEQEQDVQSYGDGASIQVVRLPDASPPLPMPISVPTEFNPKSMTNNNTQPNVVQDEFEPLAYNIDVGEDGLTEAERVFQAELAAADNCPPREDEYDPGVMVYWHQEDITTANTAYEPKEEVRHQVKKSSFGIIENNYCYTLNGKQITNCIIKIECIYEPSGYVLLSFIKEDGYSIKRRIEPNNFNTARKFRDAISDVRIKIDVTEKEFSLLKDYMLDDQLDAIHEVDHIGFSMIGSETYFVDSNSAVDKYGNKTGKVVLTGDNNLVTSNILDYMPITANELYYIYDALLSFNTPVTVLEVLGVSNSFFLKHRLWDLPNDIKTPHLAIFGKSGSGKSTTVEKILIPMFSLGYKPIGVKDITRFSASAYLASSNSIPFIMDEYKPGTLGKDKRDEFSNILRNAYDGHAAIRGTRSMSVNNYVYLAPIIVSGEECFDETALIERSMVVSMRKDNINATNITAMNHLVKNGELLHKLGRSLLNASAIITNDELLQVYNDASARFSPFLSKAPRIVNTLAICCLGLRLLDYLGMSLGCRRITEVLNLRPGELYELLLDDAITVMAPNNGESISIIDRQIQIMDVMIGSGDLVDDIDYRVIDTRTGTGKILALRIPSLYPKFIKHIGPRYRNLETITSEEQFGILIKDTPYFVTNAKQRIGGTAMMCCCLSCDELLKSPLDIPHIQSMI